MATPVLVVFDDDAFVHSARSGRTQLEAGVLYALRIPADIGEMEWVDWYDNARRNELMMSRRSVFPAEQKVRIVLVDPPEGS